jgi:hypothetical protein
MPAQRIAPLLAPLLASVLLAAAALPVRAADPAPAKPEAGKPEAVKAEILGFRSARFGMGEDELRKAIGADFSKAEAIKVEENALLRTRQLTLKVPDLLPKGGTAQLVYTLGYVSQKLIQVDVLWSKAIDAALKPEVLIGNATLLRANFERQSFRPDSVAVNVPHKDGVVMFQAADARNRMVQLVMFGKWGERKGDQAQLTPTELHLSYLADPANPDVFKLQPGQF